MAAALGILARCPGGGAICKPLSALRPRVEGGGLQCHQAPPGGRRSPHRPWRGTQRTDLGQQGSGVRKGGYGAVWSLPCPLPSISPAKTRTPQEPALPTPFHQSEQDPEIWIRSPHMQGPRSAGCPGSSGSRLGSSQPFGFTDCGSWDARTL